MGCANKYAIIWMMSILALALAQLALLQATGQDVATNNPATLLRGSRRLNSLYTTADYKRIICPFLSTLVNEGIVPVKTSYHRDELRDYTIDAGIDPVTAEAHIWSNFKDIPSGEIDIFDMEGLPNEHHTSTGINDCNTFVHTCITHDAGHRECSTETQNKMCGVPSQVHFDSFFQIADVNPDNVLTSAELAAKRRCELFFWTGASLPTSITLGRLFGLLPQKIARLVMKLARGMGRYVKLAICFLSRVKAR